MRIFDVKQTAFLHYYVLLPLPLYNPDSCPWTCLILEE